MAGFQCGQIEICLRYFPSKGGYYRFINEEKDGQGMACLLISNPDRPESWVSIPERFSGI